VFHRNRLVPILSVLALATAAAATAAIHRGIWTPPTACLMCEARSSDAASLANGVASGRTGAGANAHAGNSAGTYVPDSLIAAGPAADAMTGSSSRAASVPKGWQPWGAGSGSFRVASSSEAGPSPSLGGLWKLMSLSRPGHGGGSGAAVRSSNAPKAQKPPAASRTPKPGSHSSGPAGSVTAGSGTLAAAPVSAATDPFHEQETPSPAPFSPPSGNGGGSFDPGRPGGIGLGAGGSARVSATPEPGSVLLLGSGLLGILGVMRKRRLL
jgi:hypothetical protein